MSDRWYTINGTDKIMHSRQCTLYCVHGTLYTPHWLFYTQQWKLHNAYCTLHTAHCTCYTAHFTPHTTHCTLHIVNYIIHATHYTTHTAHHTIHTAHGTLHTTRYTLHTTHSLQPAPVLGDHIHHEGIFQLHRPRANWPQVGRWNCMLLYSAVFCWQIQVLIQIFKKVLKWTSTTKYKKKYTHPDCYKLM